MIYQDVDLINPTVISCLQYFISVISQRPCDVFITTCEPAFPIFGQTKILEIESVYFYKMCVIHSHALYCNMVRLTTATDILVIIYFVF